MREDTIEDLLKYTFRGTENTFTPENLSRRFEEVASPAAAPPAAAPPAAAPSGHLGPLFDAVATPVPAASAPAPASVPAAASGNLGPLFNAEKSAEVANILIDFSNDIHVVQVLEDETIVYNNGLQLHKNKTWSVPLPKRKRKRSDGDGGDGGGGDGGGGDGGGGDDGGGGNGGGGGEDVPIHHNSHA
jgi:uncharacterized membrane protein YgcG